MIRLLTAIAGDPTYAYGTVVSLTPEVEQAWLEAGLAEPWSEAEAETIETMAGSVVETAAGLAPETGLGRQPARARTPGQKRAK